MGKYVRSKGKEIKETTSSEFRQMQPNQNVRLGRMKRGEGEKLGKEARNFVCQEFLFEFDN